jgi:hypothetical protein
VSRGTGGASDLYKSTIPLNEIIGDPQSQSGTSDALGGKEGLEDPGHRCLVHASSVVCDNESNAINVHLRASSLPATKVKLPSKLHRIDRIPYYVQHNLPKLTFMTMKLHLVSSKFRADGRIPEPRPVESYNRLKKVLQIQIGGFTALAMESQGMRCNL